MATIPASEARSLFTKALVAIYRERTAPTSFLRSKFKEAEYLTKNLSIEVQRGSERVAVDVLRGTQGNRNTFNRSTEKIMTPPYYREYFELTELDAYDNVFSNDGSVSTSQFSILIEAVRMKMNMLIDKIERAYELQCAQVLQTGIVTLANGDNIDYKRKANSMVDKTSGTPEPWTTGSVDPIKHLQEGAKFIREVGKSTGAVMDLVLGGKAFNALLNNTTFQSRADIKSFSLDAINEPQRNSVGASFHGRVSAGSYIMNVWTYPQVYENSGGTATPYVAEENIIIVPENPNFELSYAAVPVLDRNGEYIAPAKGKFHFGKYVDERSHSVDHDVRSAGLAIPVAVDQIFTAKVVS